jgi:hypothetical protein
MVATTHAPQLQNKAVFDGWKFSKRLPIDDEAI